MSVWWWRSNALRYREKIEDGNRGLIATNGGEKLDQQENDGRAAGW
jgi:hypothetical protein